MHWLNEPVFLKQHSAGITAKNLDEAEFERGEISYVDVNLSVVEEAG